MVILDARKHFFVVSVFLLFVFLLLALHFHSLNNGFFLDDQNVIFGPDGVGAKSWEQLFTVGHSQFFRPVGHVLMKLSFHLFLYEPWGYRLVNILLLAGVGIAFYALLILLGASKRVSLLAISLYLIHPFQGNSIQYITMSHLLVGVLLALVSMHCFIDSNLNIAKQRLYWVSFISFIGAILSHETNLIVLIGILLWGAVYKRVNLVFIQRFVLLCVAAFVFIYIRGMATSFHHFFLSPLNFIMHHFDKWISSWMDLLGWYIQHLIWPDKVLFLWSTPFIAQSALLKAALAVSSCAGVIYWLFCDRIQPKVRFLFSFFFFGLALSGWACFIYKDVQPFIEPHWFFFTSIGFYVLSAYLLFYVLEHSRILGACLTVSVIVILSFMTFNNNDRFLNEETYSRYWLSLNKGSFTPYSGLFEALVDKGNFRQACALVLEGTTVLDIKPPELYPRLAYSFSMIGNKKIADIFLNEAFRLGMFSPDDLYYYALYSYEIGDIPAAKRFSQKYNLMSYKSPRILERPALF